MAPPTPRPASARASSPAPRSRGARAEEAEPTPVPASFGESPSTGSRHDPSSDLTWALLGGIGALVGALILALGALLQGPLNIAAPFDSLIVFSGLAIATGGAFATVLVVLTGKRGRRKARPMLSIIAATALALFVALVPVGVRLGVDYAQGSSYWAPVYAMLEPGPAIAPGTPALPLTTPTDPLETTAAVADADDGTDQTESDEPTGDDLEPPVEDVTSAPAADASSGTADPEPVTVRATPPPVRTAPAPVRTTPPRTTTPPATTRPTRVAPAPVVSKPPPRDEPIDMEDELDLPDDVLADTPPKRPTSSSSGSSLPERPPTTAIDLIMRNNVEIKKCFFYYQKEHGELPKQVDVRFSISPGGASSAITVVQSKYAATDLERCLQGAIKGITFPPSQLGEKLTFPFRL